jgi:hypothetical protein
LIRLDLVLLLAAQPLLLARERAVNFIHLLLRWAASRQAVLGEARRRQDRYKQSGDRGDYAGGTHPMVLLTTKTQTS